MTRVITVLRVAAIAVGIVLIALVGIPLGFIDPEEELKDASSAHLCSGAIFA